jgi:hypothetical protein
MARRRRNDGRCRTKTKPVFGGRGRAAPRDPRRATPKLHIIFGHDLTMNGAPNRGSDATIGGDGAETGGDTTTRGAGSKRDADVQFRAAMRE